MVPPSALNPDEIELANAHGPYTHGIWAAQNVVVGNEEALTGRASFLSSTVRRCLLERFTAEEMASMTLVDVGCYDGWLLCQLEDLPFKRLIGVEPRTKNIDKGQMIRRLLGIHTRCEFRIGAIEHLQEVLHDVTADVVVCAGLFHHLPSTAAGVSQLYDVCQRFLMLDTICFPAALEDERLRTALELKDLPYFFGSEQFGVSGHKLESGYYDGSATRLSVVSLPSVGALRMFLEVEGFTNVNVVVDPQSYSEAVEGGWRNFSEVFLTAERGRDKIDVSHWVEAYEGGLVRTLLPRNVAAALHGRFCGGEASDDGGPMAAIAASIITDTSGRGEALLASLAEVTADRFTQEIVKNLRYAPADKIALEYAKVLLADGDLIRAEAILLGVTRHLNADWRSVYRSFCVMVWLLRQTGDLARSERYVQLCRTANPGFPDTLLMGSSALFRRP
jgi:hypothetical protein